MPISFVPAAGDCLMCDYGPDPRGIVAPGVMRGPLAVPPEIHKFRPVAVVSSSAGTSIVVPFSTSAPRQMKSHHVHVPAGLYAFLAAESWLKADLISAVSHDRLDRVRIGGRHQRASLSAADLRALRAACLNALQLGRLVGSL